jgi:hypothetical protein
MTGVRRRPSENDKTGLTSIRSIQHPLDTFPDCTLVAMARGGGVSGIQASSQSALEYERVPELQAPIRGCGSAPAFRRWILRPRPRR